MCDNCIVCGVKFDITIRDNNRCIQSCYDWNEEICYWCFSHVGIEIIRVVKHGGTVQEIDKNDHGIPFKRTITQSNYKEFSLIRDRIASINPSLITPTSIAVSIGCPRCGGKLIKKEAEEPFTGKKYMIDKCQSCGWC